jgi:hypothetical protein
MWCGVVWCGVVAIVDVCLSATVSLPLCVFLHRSVYQIMSSTRCLSSALLQALGKMIFHAGLSL